MELKTNFLISKTICKKIAMLASIGGYLLLALLLHWEMEKQKMQSLHNHCFQLKHL